MDAETGGAVSVDRRGTDDGTEIPGECFESDEYTVVVDFHPGHLGYVL